MNADDNDDDDVSKPQVHLLVIYIITDVYV